MGPGIQGNRENLPDHDFYLFDVWDIDNQCYFTSMETVDFVADCEDLGYKVNQVPLLGILHIMNYSLNEILAMTDIKSLNHPVAEGIVYRARDRSTSFKAINNKFLLDEK
jgi:ATP-dependent RNA circularization protein (DNA/RNA ligase family)